MTIQFMDINSSVTVKAIDGTVGVVYVTRRERVLSDSNPNTLIDVNLGDNRVRKYPAYTLDPYVPPAMDEYGDVHTPDSMGSFQQQLDKLKDEFRHLNERLTLLVEE